MAVCGTVDTSIAILALARRSHVSPAFVHTVTVHSSRAQGHTKAVEITRCAVTGFSDVAGVATRDARSLREPSSASRAWKARLDRCRRFSRGAPASSARPRSAGYSSGREASPRQRGHRHSPTSMEFRAVVRDKCADTDCRRVRNHRADTLASLPKRPGSRRRQEPITSSSW